MKRFTLRRLVGVTTLVAALGAVTAAFAGSGSEPSPDLGPTASGSAQGPVLDHLTDGWSAVRLGFGVTPLRSQFGPAVLPGAHGGESERPLDVDSRGTAVSFDLKLGWPGAAKRSPLEPYLAIGPALFVIEPDYAGRLLGTRLDPTLQLGAKAGAGVTWRLGKRANLFGAYEVTTAGPGGLASGDARAPDSGISGYDFRYGLRFLY